MNNAAWSCDGSKVSMGPTQVSQEKQREVCMSRRDRQSDLGGCRRSLEGARWKHSGPINGDNSAAAMHPTEGELNMKSTTLPP